MVNEATPLGHENLTETESLRAALHHFDVIGSLLRSVGWFVFVPYRQNDIDPCQYKR